MILDKWSQLTVRERILSLVALALVIVAFCYYGVFSPIANAIYSQKQAYFQARDDYDWLQQMAPRMARAKQMGLLHAMPSHSAPMVSLQQLLAKGQLLASITHVKQSDGSFELSGKKVSFDALMRFIDDAKPIGFSLIRLNVSADEMPGVVDGSLVLQVK